MFKFIVICVILYSIYKCNKRINDKENPNYVYISGNKLVKLNIVPGTISTDSFGLIDRMCGSIDYYIDKDSKIVADGIILPNKYGYNYLTGHSSVISANVEHIGETKYENENGYYTAFITKNQAGETKPLANYFYYTPTKCQICGNDIPRVIRRLSKDDGSEIYTGDLADSVERYCPHCLARLKSNTETFYPFFIDTLYKKLITIKNRKSFDRYMSKVRDVKYADMFVTENFTPSFSHDLARYELQDEYTKNIDVCDIWEVVKVCK